MSKETEEHAGRKSYDGRSAMLDGREVAYNIWTTGTDTGRKGKRQAADIMIFIKKVSIYIFLLLAACQPAVPAGTSGQKTIVVTYSILGAVVKDLAGDNAVVTVLVPNGQDPHEWEPSARDMETLLNADLIVQNGLGLEGGMEKALGEARAAGVKIFTASDHIVVRRVGPGEGIPSGDPDQTVGAEDPHLWMDPVAMQSLAHALTVRIQTDLGLDLTARDKDLDARLDALNIEVTNTVNTLPAENRKLVTGHESMGYFAQRYGFLLVGAISPSLTTQGEVSASDLAALKTLIETHRVKAVFTEIGTSRAVSDAIGQETGVKVVVLPTHTLPEDGSYFSFLRNVARVLVDNLK
jgi:zinc/manganese transport system substrate-binding protein